MKRIIGLDRELKLRWLDIAASLAENQRDKLALRAALMEQLAVDIPAHFVRVKTCTVLIKTWLTVLPAHVDLRDRAFVLLKQVQPDQRIAVHWGMLLLAYPFFRETVAFIGRDMVHQDVVSRGQISRKVIETWGDRTTVKRSILRVFQSLVEWRILNANGSNETFQVIPAKPINDHQLALWLIEVILQARGSEAPFLSLISASENFPFRLTVSLTDLTRSGRFLTFREGSDTLVGISAKTVNPDT